MTNDAHNKGISLLFLILFTVMGGAVLVLSGGGVGFMLAPMACDTPSSCNGILSSLAVLMLMLFPIELIVSLIAGWVCFFTQRYNRSMWLTWGCTLAWVSFLFINI
ncbi:hypothetical protein OQJ13_04085 [Legionella sp. PATHC035]|uniref:hypothetical protein n=1 Tax=Legionella TaxID=445 RepID=UPI0004913876|nr:MULTISPECIES: hypothetical protein [Legionella]MCW8408148.1 hypothetical protein [Legionella sp. PATHC035]